MTDRSDRIPLPPTERRCVPSGPCQSSGKCARRQATIPAHGAIIFDGVGSWKQTVGGLPTAGIAFCPQFVDISTLKKPQPEDKKVKPWIGNT